MEQVLTYQEIAKRLSDQRIYVEFVDMSRVGLDEKPDNGMRGRLLGITDEGVSYPGDPPELRLWFDLSEFEEYNQSKASHDWRDKEGNACLTWFESGYYPADGKINFYVDGPMDAECRIFSLIEIGCDTCEGDVALLDGEKVKVFLDATGKMDVFLDGADEPAASAYLRRCPECGRPFPAHED